MLSASGVLRQAAMFRSSPATTRAWRFLPAKVRVYFVDMAAVTRKPIEVRDRRIGSSRWRQSCWKVVSTVG